VAQGRHPHKQLKGVNVVGNRDELGLLLFNQRGHVLESGGLGSRVFLSSSLGRSSFPDMGLLGSRCLGAVLVEEGENGHGLILAMGLGELDGALTLDANILWPFNETAQVTALGTNVTTNSVVAGLGGVERSGQRP
jgi:hypothetical protein